MKRIAVVGFGFMGITHALNILQNKNLKLVAIVDKNPGLIEENLTTRTGNISTGHINADQLASINKYSNLDECLEKEDLDAVNICVHTNLHYEMTRKVLLHDKHVFLEKPFCLDVEQAEELINLAEKKNKILMVGHVVRFTPPYQNLKQWVDSKEFGELIFLSLTRFCGLPGWGQWKEKQVANSSGGALFDLVIHDIDFASYILGSPDLIECSSIPGEMSSHDYISAVWHYKNKNVKVSIEGGNIFHISFPFQAGFIAKFEKVSIHYSSSNGNMIRIADNKNVREVPAGDAVTGYFNETAYFAECLINNSQPKECMPNSSLESIKLCYRHI